MNDPERHEAEIAAEQDANTDANKILWIIAGIFANVIGLLIAYIYQPTPPLSRLFEKSETYKMFYTDSYKTKIRKIQFINALIGLSILISVYVIIFVVAVFKLFYVYEKTRLF